MDHIDGFPDCPEALSHEPFKQSRVKEAKLGRVRVQICGQFS